MKLFVILLKLFTIIVVTGCCITTIALVIFYQNLKSNTPQLSYLAQKVGKPTFAMAFNYTKSANNQLFNFSKNLGLENNKAKEIIEPPTKNIGAQGFLIFDIQPQNSAKIFTIVDNILNDILSSTESQDDVYLYNPIIFRNNLYSEFEENNKPLIVDSQNNDSPFAMPLTSLVEELWNGKTLLLGGATQLQLTLKEDLLLAIENNFKQTLNTSSQILKNIIFNNFPVLVKNFLIDHSINISIEHVNYDKQKNINHSKIIFSIKNPKHFLNSICSEKINPWDFCGRFGFKRIDFRKNFHNILTLLNKDSSINLDVFWSIQGHTIVFSNQNLFVEKLVQKQENQDSSNILTSVSSSGADFFLPTESFKNYSSITFLFDMISAQIKIIDFIERLRKNSSILSDYFSSPSGEITFANFESTINKITSYSENASITFETDGHKLIPKIRLYTPIGDLFANNGKELNPETLNALRIFITKSISFGNYVLPRGLIPLPGPYINRNGRWVIIQSEIPVKSMAPFLESIDPYVDSHDNPTKF